MRESRLKRISNPVKLGKYPENRLNRDGTIKVEQEVFFFLVFFCFASAPVGSDRRLFLTAVLPSFTEFFFFFLSVFVICTYFRGYLYRLVFFFWLAWARLGFAELLLLLLLLLLFFLCLEIIFFTEFYRFVAGGRAPLLSHRGH